MSDSGCVQQGIVCVAFFSQGIFACFCLISILPTRAFVLIPIYLDWIWSDGVMPNGVISESGYVQ